VNVAGIRANGAGRHFGHLTKPYAALAPIEFITQYLSRPASLALRLFGNIFAGGIMVSVIALLPPYILWLPNAGWKLFDMFIGVIQALIFTLLTLIYFSEAVGSEDGHAH
jgi:F-type H+-transporting ATPase subunit a